MHVFPPVVHTWETEAQGKLRDFPVFTWEDSWQAELKSRVQFISSHPGRYCPQWRLPVYINRGAKGSTKLISGDDAILLKLKADEVTG